jgi:hypothetical protein
METEVTAYFSALTISNQTYDFVHLEPFKFKIASQLAKRDLRVHVTFSSHCFSRGYDPQTHPDGEPINLDAAGRPRTFRVIRYWLSWGYQR